jgi:hypothetical protein
MQVASTTVLGLTKHQLLGVIVVVVAVAIFGWGAFRLAIKAAKASLFFLVGIVAVVVAVLLFTRVI